MNGKRSTSRQDSIALLLLVAMVLWFAHEMVWSNQVPFYRDLSPYFYPMRFILAQSFKAGELPLWDRHTAMGFPLLADFQSAAFYPPHLFYLILPFFAAVRATFLFHYLVAATGSYMLCRRWNYPPYLSLIGAILFALGGAIVSLSNLLNHFQTAVWLPWVVFSWERVLRSGSWKDFLVLTLMLLLHFLAGSPELYAMGMGLLLLDGLRVKMAERNLSYGKTFFLLAAANALIVGLAMVQVLPTIELLLWSRGGNPIIFEESALWSLHPASLMNLFFLDKEVDTNVGTGVHLFFVRDIPFFLTHYMGAISLFGICLWFFYSSRKEKGLLLGLIIISLTLALGGYTRAYSLLFQYLPFFSLFRFPEKFFFLTYTFLLFITLRGLYDFLERRRPLSKGTLLVLSLIPTLLLLVYAFLRFDIESLIRFVLWATGSPAVFLSTLKGSSGVLVSLERQIALAVGICFLLFLWQKGKVQSSLFKVLIVGLVFVDLTSAHQPYQYLLDPEFVYKSPKVIASPDTGPNRLFYYPRVSSLHPSYYSILRQPSFPEFQSLVFSTLLPNTGVFHGFDYMQEIDALRRWPYVLFLGVANGLPSDELYRLLGALNVKYIISFLPLSSGDASLLRHFPEYPSWLYTLKHTVPRVFIVSKTTGEKDPLKILHRLSSGQFDPLKEVILDQSLSIASRKNFQGQATIERYTNHKVTIRASLNGSGILVLADSFYPGWQVYVDGKQEKILRANLFFRAVPLAAGEHIVEFRYEPLSFQLGLIISLATFAGVILWSAAFFFRGERNTS